MSTPTSVARSRSRPALAAWLLLALLLSPWLIESSAVEPRSDAVTAQAESAVVADGGGDTGLDDVPNLFVVLLHRLEFEHADIPVTSPLPHIAERSPTALVSGARAPPRG